ncbi:MAG: carbohydrate ABC transporter permease [Lachnospiraceae bacterium]|nr:carbohydrate ABC transporter permease [Lachnospiraceae bacterium]
MARQKKLLIWIPILALAIIWLVIAGSPFLFMVLATFKTQFELLTGGVFAWPESLYLTNYTSVIGGRFFSYLINSIIVVAVSLTSLLAVASFAAYPLSRFNFKLRNHTHALIVACMAIPIHITLIPIFIMMMNVGLYDSIWALVGPYIAFNLPISVFLLTAFMASIPKELEEAAEIDGSSKYKIFFTIMLPLSKGGIATIAIFNAINMWNEFVFAFVLTRSVTNRTLPLAIWEFQSQFTNHTPMIMTVLTLSTMPMLLAFIFFQKKLIKGMMVGAVKG